MKQSPLRSPQGGGGPVIHQRSMHPELQDEAQGTRGRAGVPQPSASPHHSFPHTDTSGVQLGLLFNHCPSALPRRTPQTPNAVRASAATPASPEPELYDSAATLCFTQTRCDTHPEQPNFRPLGYSLDGAAILDMTDAKQKQNLKQKQRGKSPLSITVVTKIHSEAFVFGF